MSIYETGTGFLPPLIRAYGGLLAILMTVEAGDPDDIQVTQDELKANIRAANESFAGLIKPAALPQDLWDELSRWRLSVSTFAASSEPVELDAIRDLMQDVWIFAARLDYELLGHENSLAGTTP
jgi:hypothetical protein